MAPALASIKNFRTHTSHNLRTHNNLWPYKQPFCCWSSSVILVKSSISVTSIYAYIHEGSNILPKHLHLQPAFMMLCVCFTMSVVNTNAKQVQITIQQRRETELNESKEVEEKWYQGPRRYSRVCKLRWYGYRTDIQSLWLTWKVSVYQIYICCKTEYWLQLIRTGLGSCNRNWEI